MSIHTQAITTEEVFHQLDELYHQCFGEASVPTAVLQSWYHTYPQGLIGLFEGPRLIGGLSIWALQEQAYLRFASGQLPEKQLAATDLQPQGSQWFYLSEIAIAPPERHKTRLMALLRGLIDHLQQQAILPAQVLALAYSPEGFRVMSKLGFSPLLEASQTADRQALLRWDIHTARTLSDALS